MTGFYILIHTKDGVAALPCATEPELENCLRFMRGRWTLSEPIYWGSLENPSAGEVVGRLYVDGYPRFCHPGQPLSPPCDTP